MLKSVWEGWQRFWFEPKSTSTLAVIRIGYGLVVVGFALSLTPDVFAFFSETGVLPQQPTGDWLWGILGSIDSRGGIVAFFVVFVIACLCLLVGFQTRIAAVMVWICVLAIERRNPFVFNSGDGLIKVLGFYLMLAPTGAALSVDRWRADRQGFWDFPLRSQWAVRLIQIQISVIYLATVFAKLGGDTWHNGTAVGYALRIYDLARFTVPYWISDSLLLMNLATFATVAAEISLGILVWNRRARPWVLALGVLLHLGIDLSIMVGFFSYAIFVGYLAFVPPETMDRVLSALRSRLQTSKIGLLRRLSGPVPAPKSA